MLSDLIKFLILLVNNQTDYSFLKVIIKPSDYQTNSKLND